MPPREQEAAPHGRHHARLDRVGGRPPGAGAGRRGRADGLRPREAADRPRGQAAARRRPTCSSSTSTSPRTSRRSRAELGDRWGRVDGVLHAIAFAPEDALGGRFLTTPAESAITAFQTSAFSFKALAVALADLYPDEGASVVGMDFDASVAWPVYDWMGVAKAALEATSRYLARDLGPRGVRVNLVSAGPIGTIAARGIPGFSQLADLWEQQAPLQWSTDDAGPGRRRGLLPALRPRARDHRRDPPRRRRLPRDGRADPGHGGDGRAAAGRGGGMSRVLLTGATGFLGMEVLARLLERTDHDVRLPRPRGDAEAASAARRRARHALQRRRAAPRARARPARRSHRAASPRPDADVDVVCHCAASISFDLPLEEARAINVEGTRAMLAPRARGRRPPLRARLHRLRRRHARGHVHRGHARHGVPQHLRADQVRGGAASWPPRATAWRSRSRGRASSMGESDTGWTPAFNVLYWPLRAFARGLFDQVPARPEGRVDVVPVDYVADGIADADRQSTPPARSTSSRARTRRRVEELADVACAHFGRPRPPYVQTGALGRRGGRRARRGLPAVLRHGGRVRRHAARASCSGCGRRSSPPTSTRCIDYADRAKWGKRGTREEARERVGAYALGPVRRRTRPRPAADATSVARGWRSLRGAFVVPRRLPLERSDHARHGDRLRLDERRRRMRERRACAASRSSANAIGSRR